ncbi:MAG TPA: DNA polymerase, partial [Candidatus Babeliales bacterium]|nr:DNA polymerase [Candidatus Babeliales bacterium]
NLITPEWQRNGLKSLSVHFFNEQMLSYDDVVKSQKLENFSYSPLAIATKYAAGDAHQTMKLATLLKSELHNNTRLEQYYYTIEHPLIEVLFKMEIEGIPLDPQVLKKLHTDISNKLTEIEKEIIKIIGQENAEINLNSPKQVEELLFKKLNLPPQKKSAKGTSYSTDQEVLEVLATMHPVPALILKYRELFKLESTYVDALPTFINPKTGKIHTTYSQVGVATGRLASFEPNLQNIPVSGYGIEIRAAFVPKPSHVFISADYSQIELRVLAHLSGDKNLTNAFLKGLDIHAETASRLFDVPLAQVTNEQRQVGKRINFSILYGLTPYGLSKDLGIPFKEAKQYIDKYFAQYPGVSAWMEKTVEDAKETGYVETVWGRRRYVPQLHERNKMLYEEARRVAINMPAQGTASDIMKKGMINLDAEFVKNKMDAQMLLQIHDELLISVPQHEAATMQQLIKKVLENAVDWNVPLLVTTRVGHNWREVSK